MSNFGILRRIVPVMLLCVAMAACAARPSAVATERGGEGCDSVRVAAARTEVWRPLLADRRVALLSNHTGMVDSATHVLDLMLEEGVRVTTLFSPEHGFRGTADAGEHVKSGRDERTGLPIASMYDGRNRTPSPEVMDGFDVLVVDLQDVGARFYTYHITMLDLMGACAKAGKPVVVFDRPNPLGMVTDGPVLDMRYASGVGRIPVPVIHGMTMGEIARMANGEGWLRDSVRADLTVVAVEGYRHSTRYDLPVAPSPNLKDMQAVLLYPSLCLFEGTPLSVGRGTDAPFTMYGYPGRRNQHWSFTPESRPGAKHPPLEGRKCRGRHLSRISRDSIIAAGFNPEYLIDAYHNAGLSKERFFTSFFNKLAGNDRLQRQIADGVSADEIRRSWKAEVDSFKARRKPYMIYPE